MSSSLPLFLLLSIFLLTTSQQLRNLQSEFEYDDQDDWPGICQEGHQQSPIDISDAEEICDHDLIFNLQFSQSLTDLTVVDGGDYFVANYEDSFLFASDINGVFTGYQSVNFHFHSPSEHRVDGKSYDLELHLLHLITEEYWTKGQTKKIFAAFAVFFEVDEDAAPNPFISALHLGKLGSKLEGFDMSGLLYNQFPSPISYFTYQGSVTTPPCAEVVNWYVMTTPLKITKDQLKVFTKRFAGNETFADGKGNNRDLQDLNHRVIKIGGVDCESGNALYFVSFVAMFVVANYVVAKLL